MQLHRDLELTQKTTWLLLNKLRKSSSFENGHILANEVEIDETYVGGKGKKGEQGRSLKKKTPVMGLLTARLVYARVVLNTKAKTLLPIIDELVRPGSLIISNE